MKDIPRNVQKLNKRSYIFSINPHYIAEEMEILYKIALELMYSEELFFLEAMKKPRMFEILVRCNKIFRCQ